MRTIRLCILTITLGLAGLSLSTAAADTGSGSAASVPALPDPIANPVESVSLVVKLWKSGTMPAAIIVGLFLVLTVLSRKVTRLQKGYAAIIIASALGGCSMLIERAASGTTPTAQMFMGAIVAALALALKPTPTPKAPAEK